MPSGGRLLLRLQRYWFHGCIYKTVFLGFGLALLQCRVVRLRSFGDDYLSDDMIDSLWPNPSSPVSSQRYDQGGYISLS